jgi:hypothetical protein
MTITIFSWGYYGWGNHTAKWIDAVDAVEEGRGFAPPTFVDIRIRRTGRAKGFQGPAFEKLLGPKRHRWMKSLGNMQIQTRTGPAIQIADPGAACELLDLAVESAKQNRRVFFFCSCQWPRCDGKVSCHRTTVAGLVLKAAKQRKQPVEVVEWPGSEPQSLEIASESTLLASVRKGRMTVPLGQTPFLPEVAGLAWCSVATLRSGDEAIHRLVGPASWQKDQWALPVLFQFFDPDAGVEQYQKEASKLRRAWGLKTQSV